MLYQETLKRDFFHFFRKPRIRKRFRELLICSNYFEFGFIRTEKNKGFSFLWIELSQCHLQIVYEFLLCLIQLETMRKNIHSNHVRVFSQQVIRTLVHVCLLFYFCIWSFRAMLIIQRCMDPYSLSLSSTIEQLALYY